MNEDEKKAIIIEWFLDLCCDEFPIYDKDVNTLLRKLEGKEEKR